MDEHHTPPPQHSAQASAQQSFRNPHSAPVSNIVGQDSGQLSMAGNQPPQGWTSTAQVSMPAQQPEQPYYQAGLAPQMANLPQQRHDVPKCLNCGTIIQWRVEPILLARHIIIFLVLLLFFGAGLLYLLIVLIIRSGSNARSKICPHCGARNLWTFIY